MKSRLVKDQAGFALILVVLVLMSMGGVVLAGFSQEARKVAETQRYEHNERVLKEAKQALLMYAYNYPQFNLEGPGRLPCPDTDNDGLPGDTPGPLTIAMCESVGRLPWRDPNLEFYDARDAGNENLWYAVSSSFHNLGGGPVINSNSAGTITLFDQSGGIINDGTGLGAYPGIAAVIIAPGLNTGRDEDDNGSYEYTQVRGTDPERNDPRNYLDTFPGGFDNSAFINAANNIADGFSLGPIYDPAVNEYMLNDQMIVITTEEVIAMAEKATLQAYRDSIDVYLANTGSIYPWLDDYASLVTPADLLEFDAEIGNFKGRVPAVFNNYFAGAGQEIPFYTSQTRLRIEPDPGARNPGDLIEFTPPQTFTDVSFDNANGNLLTSLGAPYAATLYFWDGSDGSGSGSEHPNSPRDDVWELCTGTASAAVGGLPEDDCNRKTDGTFKTAADLSPLVSDVWLGVYRVTITLNGAGRFTLPFADIVATGPSAFRAATGGENAYVFGLYDDAGGSFAIFYEFDAEFQNGFDIMSSDTVDELTAGVVYYPELPAWALDDDWHHSVQMAIAEDYIPGGNNTDCTVNDCLVVNNLGGVNDDKVSLLVIAGEIDIVDESADGFFDDLTGQFEAENDTADVIYDRRAGNDSVLVLQ